MSDQETPEHPTKPGSGPAGPYEFLTFVAGSLGKALPIVVVLALIVIGAFYGLRQISEIQHNASLRQEQLNKRLDEAQLKLETAQSAAHDAQTKELEATAKAANATSNAKNEFLLEYSKQLKTLADDSENMSRSLQQLVATQIANMQALQKAQADQEKEAEASRDQQEKKSKADLARLQLQINEAQAKSEQLAQTARLASYNFIKADVGDKLRKNAPIGDEGDLLFNNLSDEVVSAQATRDASDVAQAWQIRLALNLQLYKRTSRAEYLDATEHLLRENAQSAGSAVADLFCVGIPFTEAQLPRVSTLISALILEQKLPLRFRDLLPQVFFVNYQIRAQMSPDQVTQVARHVGTRLVQLADTGLSDCPPTVSAFFYVLGSLNSEAELVYDWQALQKLSSQPSNQPSCIRPMQSILTQAVAGRQPTKDQLQKWLPLPHN